MGSLLLCAQLVMGQAAPTTTTPPPTGSASGSPTSSDDAVMAIRDDTRRQESRLMFELMAWGETNVIVSGLAFLAARGPFARALELQLAVWGVGEAGVAVVSLIRAKRDKSEPGSIEAWLEVRGQDRRRHRRDALVALVGLVITSVVGRLRRLPRWRGTAAAIALQCGFLMVFNLLASLVFGG